MRITYDEAKRQATLQARSIDFKDASAVFSGPHFTAVDDRQDYGETRYITIGLLNTRMVVIVWTPRNTARRIISMRKANEREQEKYFQYLG